MVIGLPFIISFVFLIPAVQTKVVSIITSRLSDDLDAEISIDKVSVLPFAGMKISDILVKDQKGDSLFFANKVKARVETFSLKEKTIFFREIKLDNFKTYLAEDDGGMNFYFLSQLFKGEKVDREKWGYIINGLKLDNGDLLLKHPILKNNSIFKNNELYFTDIKLTAEIYANYQDSVKFIITNFAFKEKTGVNVNGFRTNGYFTSKNFIIDRLAFYTDESIFNFSKIDFSLDSDTKGVENFNTEINKVVISTKELKNFIPQISKVDELFTLAGKFSGNSSSLKGKDVKATFGSSTILNTNFDITDYSNFNQAFLYLNLESSKTDVSDIARLLPDKELIPTSLYSLGTINYDGNITGFISDLVAFGTFKTSAGTLKTDLGVKFKEGYNLIFAGGISTDNFELNKISSEDLGLGDVAFSLDIQGQRKDENDFFVYMDGDIDKLNFKEYLYENVEVEGLLTADKFDGQLIINDENGQLDFIGSIGWDKKVPNVNFVANARNVHLDRLNIMPKLNDAVLSMSIESSVEGNNIDDLNGYISLKNVFLLSPDGTIDFDDASLILEKENGSRKMLIKSPYINGELSGKTDFSNFLDDFYLHISQYLPSFIETKSNFANLKSGDNDFRFRFEFTSAKDLLNPFFSEIKMPNIGYLAGRFNSREGLFEIDASIDELIYKNITASDMSFRLFSSDKKITELSLRADNIASGNFISLPNFALYQKIWEDTITTNLFWNNWDNITNSGAIYTKTNVRKLSKNKLLTQLEIEPSTLIIQDSIWNINKSTFEFSPEAILVDNFKVERNEQRIVVDGLIHKTEDDGINVEFNDLELAHFFHGRKINKISFGGIINGKLFLKNFHSAPLLTSNININDFVFNDSYFGTFYLGSKWDNEAKALGVRTYVDKDSIRTVRGGGYFYPTENRISIAAKVDSIAVDFLAPFVSAAMQEFDGIASGNLYFKGTFPHASLTGDLNLIEGSFDVDMLNTTYYVKDSVFLYPNEIYFDNMSVADRYNERGRFKGSIYHSAGYKDIMLDLRISGTNMMFLNTTQQHNRYYYGTVFGDGTMYVKGPTDNIDISIKGRTRPRTKLFIPMETTEVAGESNFIHFVDNNNNNNRNITSIDTKKTEYKADLSGVKFDMDIEVTPDSEVQIIFDERVGDILKGRGAGNMQLRMDRQGGIKLYGDYQIHEGDYLFSLQNLINKKFDIVKGGTLKWNGDLYNADINIKTVYKLKASVSDLLGGDSNLQYGSDFQRRVQIHSNLYLTGMLLQPNIKLGIEFPTLDESRSSLLLDYIPTEEDMNRQVFSLLVLNKFYTPEYMRGEHSTDYYNNAALITTTEVLFSQINKWMSSISNDFDIGVAYRPGDNITSEEFELAMSTQVFNNRVSLNGNVGVGKYQANTSTMIGDFDVDVKLNKSGTIRAMAYTRSNEDYLYESSPTTQGVGISFNEEFNKFSQLLKKYWQILIKRREEE